MLKRSLDTPSHEAVFIRQALEKDLRLDGRTFLDWRETQIQLKRGEGRSEADVSIGDTRVIAVITGEISKPFPDRPTEGMLQFGADVCSAAENAGYNQSSVCRLIERSIKDSDCIDLESLCIVAGEHVWSLCCDIRVLSFYGNLVDSTVLAVMGALRTFRKPEVSVVINDDARNNMQPTFSARSIKIYTGDEREPLPLALHYTHLSVSLGLFSSQELQKDKNHDVVSHDGLIFLSDPSQEEEQAMDGIICFFVNSHSEICSIIKPGGVGLSIDSLMRASDIALNKAKVLHLKLMESLQILESRHVREQQDRLQTLRQLREAQEQYKQSLASLSNITHGDYQVCVVPDSSSGGGLSISDPILRYDYTHVTVGCSESTRK